MGAVVYLPNRYKFLKSLSMELGTYQLQVFISLIVILAAACVALICDYLKGNNEKLRELTIELKVRREEEQRRIQLLVPQLAAAGVTEAPVARVIAETSAKQWEDTRATKADVAPPRPWVGSKAAPTKEAPKKEAASKDAPKERKRTASPEAIAVMERGAQLTAARRAPAPSSPAPQSMTPSASAPSPSRRSWNSMLEKSRESRAPVVQTQVTQTRVAVNHIVETCVAGTHVAPTHVNESLLEAVMAATAKSRDTRSALPAGLQQDHVLTKLIEDRQQVSGLVVSVGIHNAEGARPGEIVDLVRSLLGPEDFAARPAENEFLLIFPQLQGAGAQRRLSRIAEQLWDFQLRSMGTNSALFSWGGVEVRGESIEEAMTSANERMLESQRGRKVLTMTARRPERGLRRAV
jgi:hypothetical protein